ncbi:MAG: sulfatase-like hydrolase/transferase [Flavobacteriaceae bacterium]
MRHHFLRIAIILILLPVSCKERKQQPVAMTTDATPKKPNVIVILTDDQGYKDVGFNGSTDIPTPNLDRIAQNGMVFTNGYVSYAVCGPSRAGLITGRYQDRFGFSRNPLFAPKDSLQGLPLSEETMADVLKKADYRTMAIGKWHLGAHPTQRPLKRGFDEFFGFLTGGHRYFPEEWTLADISEVKAHNQAYRTKLLKNEQRIEEQEYLTDALSREAVDFVSRHAERPFFLYLAYNAPHTPLQATQKYLDRFPNLEGKRKTYAAMVSAVDDGVGLLLNKIEELGISDNTMVFFLSDNGGPERSNASDNGLLREGKGSFYEGGIRVPFAVQWPSVIPKGVKYEYPIISLDIFATAAAQAGASPKNNIDGVDLIPYLTGENDQRPHQRLFWRNYNDNAVVLREGDIKLVRDKKGNSGLYDVKADMGETNALNDDETFNRLMQAHTKWNQANTDPIFMGLKQNNEYNQLNPDRFTNGEKY